MDVENFSKGVLSMPRPHTRRTPRPYSKADAELGARLKVLRIERGLSQIGLAERSGIDQRMISCYELGYVRIPAAELIRMAGILKVSVKEFARNTDASANGAKSRKILKLVEKIETLPPRDQRGLLRTIELAIANGGNGRRVAA